MPVYVGNAQSGVRRGGRRSHVNVGRSSHGDASTPQFDFDPATAFVVYSGDSIPALDDNTGYAYGWGIAGGCAGMAPASRQSVSGSEINEGTPATNIHDLLYPTRLACLLGALRPGDIFDDNTATNSIGDTAVANIIEGKKQLYAAVIDAGCFVLARTCAPSASNIANPDLATYNTFIRSLETDGFTYNSVFYPASWFCVVDHFTLWGGTYVGNTDSGNLHPNINGAIKWWKGLRDKLKSIGRAYHPRAFGVSNPANNIVTNWNLAAGTGGTLTGTGNTLVNNGVPTGIAVACTNNAGVTVQTDIVSSYNAVDSMYSDVPAFPVLKVTVSVAAAAVQADITLTMSQTMATVIAGTPFEASCYARVKGIGATSAPTGLHGFGFVWGSAVKWSSHNSPTGAGNSYVTEEIEGFLRGRSTPPVSAFGNSTIVFTARIRSGDAASFEIYFGQPYANRIEQTAYKAPVNCATDQDSIGGQLTGPTFTGTIGVGNVLTGRPGLGWAGGNFTQTEFYWERDSSGVITTVSGPTVITTTASTTQYTQAGSSGDKFRLNVKQTNALGNATASSPWSTPLP